MGIFGKIFQREQRKETPRKEVLIVCAHGTNSKRIADNLGLYFAKRRKPITMVFRHVLKPYLTPTELVSDEDIRRASLILAPGPLGQLVETGHGMNFQGFLPPEEYKERWGWLAERVKINRKKVVPYFDEDRNKFVPTGRLGKKVLEALKGSSSR
ncbi:MAG: hypothetical protein V1787_03935 [Candidatus Micrarchaeota archaeon]